MIWPTPSRPIYRYTLISLALLAPLVLTASIQAQSADTLPVLMTLAVPVGNNRYRLYRSYSPDGSRFTASYGKTAKVWDASSGKLLMTLEGHAGEVLATAYSPDGSRIVTTSKDNTAKVWDASSGRLLYTLEGDEGQVNSAAYSPDGSRIVTTSFDNTAKVWDASSGKLLMIFPSHTEPVTAAHSPDGSRIVTAGWDNTAKVWDASSGELLKTLEGHTSWVYSAAYSSDGSRIVTASHDKTAKVWDASSGKLLKTLEGHKSDVLSAAYSPDGSRIVTSSRDNTAKMWDASSGKLLKTLKGHQDYVPFAVYSSDGLRIVTTSYDGTVKVWDASGVSRPDRPTTGILALTSIPSGAQVFLQGKLLGKTPLSLTDLAVNTYTYTLQLEGYRSTTVQGVVQAGQTTPLKATLKRTPTPAKPKLILLSPAAGSSVSGNSFTVSLQLIGSTATPSFIYTLNGQAPRSVGMRANTDSLTLNVDLPKNLQDGQNLELMVRSATAIQGLEPLVVNFSYRKISSNTPKRWALVVGNAKYAQLRTLTNPTNDAIDIAKLLDKMGFDVTLELDRTKVQLEQAIDLFGKKLQKEPGVALFYYAGHGLEVNGINYLAPIDAAFKGASEVKYRAVDLGLVLAQMQDSKNPTNIIILDACRDNPLPDRSTRTVNSSGGFVANAAPVGTLLPIPPQKEPPQMMVKETAIALMPQPC